MPAHMASWPTRCGSTPSTARPGCSLSRSLVAAFDASSCEPVTSSGATAIVVRPAACSAACLACGVSFTCATCRVRRSTRSISRRTAWASAPGRIARTTERCCASAPWNAFSDCSTWCEPEPGTVKPPLVRLSV